MTTEKLYKITERRRRIFRRLPCCKAEDKFSVQLYYAPEKNYYLLRRGRTQAYARTHVYAHAYVAKTHGIRAACAAEHMY